MQIKVQAGLQGRKRHGPQIDGENGTRGAPCRLKCKQGSREENVMGAKLTEKTGREGHHADSSAIRGSREKKSGAPN